VGSTAPPKYGPRYAEALAYAAHLHAGQFRKSDEGVTPSIPYVAHLLEVSALVWVGGGSEDAAIAGLLHDAIEDQSHLTDYDEIERRFGPRVREIVAHCTDGDEGGDRGPEGWLDRKVTYLLRLRDGTDDEALLVTAADKVSNAGAILEDVRQAHGDVDALVRFWARFKAGAQGSAWYYAQVAAAAASRMPDNPLVQRLAIASDAITDAAGGTDVATTLHQRWGLSLEDIQRTLARLQSESRRAG
jgi:hypothetical protein